MTSKSSRRRHRKKQKIDWEIISNSKLKLNLGRLYYLWSDSLQKYFRWGYYPDNRLLNAVTILRLFQLKKKRYLLSDDHCLNKAKDWRVLKRPIYKEKDEIS